MYRATSQTLGNLARYAPARQFTPAAKQQPTLLQHVQTWRAGTQSTVVANGNSANDGRDYSKSYMIAPGYGRDQRWKDSSFHSGKSDLNGGRVTTLLPSVAMQLGSRGMQQQQQRRTLTGAATNTALEGQDGQRDTASFNERIKSLKRESNLLGVVREFSLMKSLGVARNLFTYNLVLDAFSDLRQKKSSVRPMMDVFDELLKEPFIQPSSYTYRVIIRALCIRDLEVCKQRTQLETRMQWIKDEGEEARMAALAAENNFKQAMMLFDQARTEFSEPFDLNALDLLLWAAAENADTDASLRVFEAIESSSSMVPTFQTYGALITSFGRAGDIEAARECFQVFLEQRPQLLLYGAHKSTHELVPFNSMVSALARCNEIDAAARLVETEMESYGAKPDEITYNSLISGFAQAGNLEAAERIFKKLNADPALPNAGPLSYNVIISAACKQDKTDVAYQYFNMMKSQEIPLRYGNLMSYLELCVRQDNVMEAIDVIVLMERNKDSPDVHFRQLIRSLLEKQTICIEDKVQLLKRFIESPLDYGDRHIMLRDLTVCFIDAHPDNFSEHIAILRLLHTASLRLKTRLAESYMRSYRAYRSSHDITEVARIMSQRDYVILIASWFDRMQFNTNLEQLLNDIIELMRDMKACNYQIDTIFFIKMAKRFENADPEALARWTKAVADIFGEDTVKSAMSLNGKVQQDGRSTLPKIAGQDNKEVWSLCNKLRAIARIPARIDETMVNVNQLLRLNVIMPPDITRHVIQGYASAGKFAELNQLIPQILATYDIIDNIPERNSLRQQTLSAAILAYSKNQDAAAAWGIYDIIRADGHTPSRTAYSELLRLYKGEDDLEEGMRMYEEMVTVPSAYFANILLGKVIRKKGFAAAAELFEEMRKRDLQPTSVTYGTLISAACKEDNEEAAIRYFKELCLRPEKENNPAPFHVMMQYALSRNDRASVLRYLTSMRRHLITPVPHTYRLLIESYVYVEPRDMSLAEQSLRDMLKANLRPTGAHFAPLFHGYADEGRMDRIEWTWEEMKLQPHLPDEIAYLAAIAAAEKCSHQAFAQKLRDEMFASNTTTADQKSQHQSSSLASSSSSSSSMPRPQLQPQQ
ncbi:hypothetical protein BDF19DRAFT_447584 [Syncephalis fuscata]|nr:hypothetical protein BDF19DRAFT_447584 [Syncephalis fuscata]